MDSEKWKEEYENTYKVLDIAVAASIQKSLHCLKTSSRCGHVQNCLTVLEIKPNQNVKYEDVKIQSNINVFLFNVIQIFNVQTCYHRHVYLHDTSSLLFDLFNHYRVTLLFMYNVFRQGCHTNINTGP